MNEPDAKVESNLYENFRVYKRREVASTVTRNAPRRYANLFISDFTIKPTHKNVKNEPKVATSNKVNLKIKNSQVTVTTPSASTESNSSIEPVFQPDVKVENKHSLDKLFKTFFIPKYMLPSMAVSLFLIGIGVSLQGFYQNNKAAEASNAQSTVLAANTDEAEDSEKPDETEPDHKTYGSYQVAPDLPRYIRISKINLNARVQRIGLKADGGLKAPGNIYNAGWYEKSAKPGDAGGASLFDAHVHGPTKPGAFYKLKNITDGDIIEVERGDGQKFSYKVVAKESVPTGQVNMAKALISADTSKAGLNLITCDGKYNSSTDDYENRLIVYAVQI